MSTTAIPSPIALKDIADSAFLTNGFRCGADGWFYPTGGEPLVRVVAIGGFYQMERRRTPESGWMRIVQAKLTEFDHVAFAQWADTWPMTA